MEIVESGTQVWNNILNGALKIPGARVNRSEFIKSNFSKYCTEEQIQLAIEFGSTKAGINVGVLDKIADSVINFHSLTATGTSAVAGIPGGFAMLGTVPGDLIQYYYHVIVVSQKLAYVYGYPDLEGNQDDDFLTMLTLFLGVMTGAQGANVALSKLSSSLAEQVVQRLPKVALTKYGIYSVSKQIAKWFGMSVTKQTFSRSISKAIPFVSAFISGGVTFFTFSPMAKKLKSNLRKSIS